MMEFIKEIETEIETNNIENLKNSLWKNHLSGLYLDKENKDDLTNLEIGFFSLFFKKYEQLIVPLIMDKIMPEFEEWNEAETEFEEIKLQSFSTTDLEQGAWEVFFEDGEEDLLVGLVMDGWELNYTTRVG